MKHYSPLRYPGGKNKLSPFIAKICQENNINGHYVEPYSGGASVALFLLLEGFVSKITINDRDRSIYAFWYSVLNNTESLCDLIEKSRFTIAEWKRQKEVQSRKSTADLLELGFSTFYLNRTNRSGILNAGVIGGLDQTGNYLMDCRFNKIELIGRIRAIANRKRNIKLYKKDAISLIDKIEKESTHNNVIFYFDPPYYLKASSLYMNHYKDNDHKLVSEKIIAIEKIKWIVSYDNVPEIKKLYSNCYKKEYSFRHTAYNSRDGQEILFLSSSLKRPRGRKWHPLDYKLSKKKKEIVNR
ncbi:MAG: DNA adenine methylase [Bacteroidetes bacterium]|nr:DNA adenine methylase [Bacteroidota bacterium]